MMQSKIQNTTRHLISRLKTGHFQAFLTLLKTTKKEAFSPPKITKFTHFYAPIVTKFLLHSNRKIKKKRGVRDRANGLDQNSVEIARFLHYFLS